MKRAGGGFELLMVLETAAGARQRVTVTAPPTIARDEQGAVRYLANWLTARGARSAKMLRVRVERGGQLVDDPSLKALLLAALAGPDEEEAWE